MDDTSDDWCEYLDSALFAMNTSLQNTTKFTPFYMMFGRNLRFPLEAGKEAESSSIEKAMDDIAKADADEYIGNIVESRKPFSPRKYFKLRNKVCKDDIIVLKKFKVIQLKEKLQNDAHNCGVYCLKVYLCMAMYLYRVDY